MIFAKLNKIQIRIAKEIIKTEKRELTYAEYLALKRLEDLSSKNKLIKI